MINRRSDCAAIFNPPRQVAQFGRRENGPGQPCKVAAAVRPPRLSIRMRGMKTDRLSGGAKPFSQTEKGANREETKHHPSDRFQGPKVQGDCNAKRSGRSARDCGGG